MEMDAEDAGWAGESVGRTVGTGMLGTGTWVSPYPRVNLGILGSPCSKAPQAAPRQRVAVMGTSHALSPRWLWWLQGGTRRDMSPGTVL